MKSDGNSSGCRKLAGIISLIASIIAIFAFVTGRMSLPEILGHSRKPNTTPGMIVTPVLANTAQIEMSTSTTATSESYAPVLVTEQTVPSGETQVFQVTLGNDEIIVGAGYRFNQDIEGCAAFLITGPGQFTFVVGDGKWMRYMNVPSAGQAEALLQGQMDLLVNYYSCARSELRVSRLVAPASSVSTTSTPAPGAGTPVPTHPEGYTLYDDFTAPGALDSNWWVHNNVGQVCSFRVSRGQLLFACRNATTNNLVVTLNANGQFSGIRGIAVVARVDRFGGSLKLATDWTCQADGLKRAYHLELGTNVAVANEFYPQEDWHTIELGRVFVLAGQAHLLQIEHVNSTVEFFVDSQPLPLHTSPNLSACFAISDWSLGFSVLKEGGDLEGQIEEVSVRYP
ncbi:MAG: hypothetical protein FJ014_12075 [Chloroflexi bacterium]|nr:hypothetical protein [Chloroflexota bacterium]